MLRNLPYILGKNGCRIKVILITVFILLGCMMLGLLFTKHKSYLHLLHRSQWPTSQKCIATVTSSFSPRLPNNKACHPMGSVNCLLSQNKHSTSSPELSQPIYFLSSLWSKYIKPKTALITVTNIEIMHDPH
ncbi:hypothetical protein VNO77_16255 [Canavalia gladiata]|uniref:Uncharacterized protein n=1 Tax=Canavalia gladiata TaxID=3824 RepID=A0AAN9QRX8_CANGL